LRQLLIDLVTNAEAACEARGGDRTIRVSTAAIGDMAELVVADDGIGIEKQDLARIFEPFFTTNPDGPGKGLGLSVALGIVNAHSGSIELDSTVGEGTRVRVLLPIGEPELGVAFDEETLTAGLQGRYAGFWAMVVDDEGQVRDYLKRLLGKLGFEVRAFGACEDALEALSSGSSPDVVLCDLRLPGMGGPEFFRRVAVAQPEVAERFVFVTGDVVGKQAVAFLETTTQPTLMKPFPVDALLEALGKVVSVAEE
jgi:two-component system NtrC family sensor kinase